jgi:hypothetical protein
MPIQHAAIPEPRFGIVTAGRDFWRGVESKVRKILTKESKIPRLSPLTR